MHQLSLLPILALTLGVAAKTDIGGCVSTEVPYMTRDTLVYRSLLWYLPDTGEICEILDCGGGRAPPKTNVPGCGNYAGTEEYKPRFWTGFNAEPTTSVVVPAKPTTNLNTAPAVTPTTTKKTEVPVETGAAGGDSEEGKETETESAEGPAPTTLVTVSGSATTGGEGVTRTVDEVVETTEAPDAGGNGEEAAQSTGSSSSVSTAGAAPTGAVMMGVVAGVAAAGLAFVA
ncbi:hypothetical protein QBC40DRAFT_84842 [Triangularia verruculosa]|uniref:Uncharacterized protein n=1 Tax=Triangularia verruculosa TaxID=2587418 RepID=A0AAN7AU65_9PEZI|nr:hypothetical protein QBC40DRAFT_84842 [Triangularia verruculosa]